MDRYARNKDRHADLSVKNTIPFNKRAALYQAEYKGVCTLVL